MPIVILPLVVSEAIFRPIFSDQFLGGQESQFQWAQGKMKQTIAWMLLVFSFGASGRVLGFETVPYELVPEPEVVVSAYDAVCD